MREGIAFQVPASDLEFALPTVTLGEIDLVPNNKVPVDTKYEPGIRRTVLRTLYKEIPVAVKPRTKLTLTYYFKAYDVSVDYVATIEYFNEKDLSFVDDDVDGERLFTGFQSAMDCLSASRQHFTNLVSPSD